MKPELAHVTLPSPATDTQEPPKAPESPAKAPITLDFASVAETKSLTTWAEFKPGLSFLIRFISRSELQQLSRLCTTNKYNQDTHQREPRLDSEKFLPKFINRVVKGWKGLTPKVLADLIPVDMTKIPPQHHDAEIAYDPQQMIVLVNKCFDLDTFLNRVSTDLTWFRDADESEAVKN